MVDERVGKEDKGRKITLRGSSDQPREPSDWGPLNLDGNPRSPLPPINKLIIGSALTLSRLVERWVRETLFSMGLNWMAQFVAKSPRLHHYNKTLGFVLLITAWAKEHPSDMLTVLAQCASLVALCQHVVRHELSSRCSHTCPGDLTSPLATIPSVTSRVSVTKALEASIVLHYAHTLDTSYSFRTGPRTGFTELGVQFLGPWHRSY